MSSKEEIAVQLWMFQSELMWGRLKFVTIIESAIFAGWAYFRTLPPIETLPNLWKTVFSIIVAFSIFLLFVILMLMRNDAKYMDSSKKAAGDYFPDIQGKRYKIFLGRNLSKILIGVFMILNIGLLITNWLFI